MELFRGDRAVVVGVGVVVELVGKVAQVRFGDEQSAAVCGDRDHDASDCVSSRAPELRGDDGDVAGEVSPAHSLVSDMQWMALSRSPGSSQAGTSRYFKSILLRTSFAKLDGA